MEQDAQPPVGQVFDDRYKILEVLGEGGMGMVYLGEHIVIGRQVAIKVLGAKHAKSNDFAERFRREAIAAGRLDHPNCVPVTDSGELADGSAYMVMELVKGQTLGKLLNDEGALDPQRALRILRHVLRGLSHAHSVDIVHRDIKPDNIMLVSRDEDRDFARILDFGIAKLRDEEGKASESLTQVGMAVGTPSYLSPEQAFGENIDHRSDLYSCAVLLFEMFTGRAPYVASNTIGVLTKHASAPIPHIWDLVDYLRDFPMLDALTQRGLGKTRDERFQTASEFIASVDQALMILGYELTPPPMFEQGFPTSMSTGPMPSMMRDATPSAVLTQSKLTGREATALSPQLKEQRRKIIYVTGGLIILLALVIAVISMTGNPAPARNALVPPAEVDALLQQGIEKLENSKTCKERLKGVKMLEILGDARAIPNLRNAKRRMRGGLLGVGRKNGNACLSRAAQKAIDKLGGDS